MPDNKKPSWKKRISNWGPADITIASFILTAINVGIVVFQILWLLRA